MRRIVGAIVLAGLVTAGCSGSDNASSSSTTTTAVSAANLPKVTIIATDFTFQVPPTMPSGWVNVTLTNQGRAREGHQLGLVKLDGMRFDAFRAAAASEDITKIKATFVGGPNGVDAGKVGSAVVHLAPGDYAMLCFVRGNDGVSHVKKGMVKKFTVAATPGAVEQPPTSDGAITLSDFTFVMPNAFTGNGTFEVKNVGVQVHEMSMFRILPGKTMDDVKKYLLGSPGEAPPSGAPPFASVVGMVGLSPQQTAYLPLALAPGKYALLCFFPDPTKRGAPHAIADQMVKEIDIA